MQGESFRFKYKHFLRVIHAALHELKQEESYYTWEYQYIVLKKRKVLVCFLYFQFSVCTIPNVTHVYIQNFIQFYIHISDPSKIKRILYTILNIILITSEKPTLSCGLLLDVVTDVKELRYESHVDILYVSLAYQDTILVINGASEKTF